MKKNVLLVGMLVGCMAMTSMSYAEAVSTTANGAVLEHKDQRTGVENYSYKQSPKLDESSENHKDERVGVENYSYLTGLNKDHSSEVKDPNAEHVDERVNPEKYSYLTGKAAFTNQQ